MILALAAGACVAAGAGGYLLLSGSSSSSGNSAAAPVVHHVAPRTGTTVSPTAAQKAAETQALLKRAMAAAEARGSFATAETDDEGGVTETSYGWEGATTSASTVQIPGKGQVTVRIVGPAVYLTGDGPALQSLTGDAAFADFLGGKWLEIAKGDKGYDDIMGLNTSADQKQGLFSGAVTQLPTTTVNGQRVIPLRGTPSKDAEAGPHATATLYVAANGDPLPVRFEITSDNGRDVANFSGWGSQQTVLAPAEAIDAAWLENAAAAAAAHPDDTADTSSIT